MAKKGSRGKSKGNAFEREMAKVLSNWWTGNARDDIFWRSQTSGGRATQRAKSNQETEGQYGDICAADPIGKPLLDKITFEIKRGYNDKHIHALADEPPAGPITIWDNWVSGLMESKKISKVPHWAIIHKRDARSIMIWMPIQLVKQLPEDIRHTHPLVRLRRHFWKDLSTSYAVELIGVLLDDFLNYVKPVWIKERVK